MQGAEKLFKGPNLFFFNLNFFCEVSGFKRYIEQVYERLHDICLILFSCCEKEESETGGF